MTKLLEGNIVAKQIYAGIASEIDVLKASGIVPKLTIVRANSDAGCDFYEKAIIKKCAEVGVECHTAHFDEKDCTEQEIVDTVSKCKDMLSAVIVLAPLPAHIDENRVFAAIDVYCDADCQDSASLGCLVARVSSIAPCTPKSVVKILDHYNIDVAGKSVVVVGRSQVVGKPLALMLTDLDATVTLCHSKTADLAKYTKSADIVIFAVGKPEHFGRDYVSEGSIVIDVGTSRNEAGVLCGDVKFDELNGYVSALTPVKGGVGACTTACLMQNVVECCKRLNDVA